MKKLPPTESSSPTRIVRFELSLRSMLTAVLIAASVWLLMKLAPVLLIIIVALFLVGTLAPIVSWLEAHRVRRSIAIAIVFVGLLLVVLGLGALTVPALVAQVGKLFDDEPALRSKLIQFLAKSKLTTPLADWVRSFKSGDAAKGAATAALSYSSQIFEGIAYGVSTVFLALYLMIDRDRVRGALYALVPRSHHIRLSRVLLNLEVIVGGYIRGQLITSALMAGFTFILLTIFRVPNAISIGVFAGLADVLPYVGVVLAVGPAVIAAISRGPAIMLTILAVLLVYQEFESRILVPRIYGRALRLPSSVVMVALLAGGTLMGILGALMALPVAAAIRMIVEELRVSLPGESVDETPLREADELAEQEYADRSEGVPAMEAAAIAVEISDERRKEEGGDDAEAAEVPITGGKL